MELHTSSYRVPRVPRETSVNKINSEEGIGRSSQSAWCWSSQGNSGVEAVLSTLVIEKHRAEPYSRTQGRVPVHTNGVVAKIAICGVIHSAIAP